MAKVKIAVLVSGGGSNLQALLDAERCGELTDGKIELVLSNRADAYALHRAQNAGVCAKVVERKQFASVAEFESALLAELQSHEIEMVILAGFMCILSSAFTARFPGRMINIHPSLIPAFCGKGFYGLHVHQAALQRGVKLTGATVHYVNEVPDGGEILLQKAVEVREGDTPESLQRRVMEQAEWILLPQAAQMVCRRILSQKA
ncbi:MAG: phosphoribosylglycinamide formyltransferase [Eubacteriales bacterium]|nr:phosphoribosylglycinamide formyltransferase [Eubacteriales bacterium]